MAPRRSPQKPELTQLLENWRQRLPDADSELMDAVYEELRRVAVGYLRRERLDHTLEPSALINEAYLRLAGWRNISWENRTHFFAIAAKVMRRVLVDYARRRNAAVRQRFDGERVTLSQVADPGLAPDADILSLNEALDELAALDQRQADIVTLRYFGGLTVDEIVSTQKLSRATVNRELATAKLWLRRKLRSL